MGGRARPRNSFARFPPCFKNTSRGALRLSSKAVPEKEADGRKAAAQENSTGAERLPYAGSGTQMVNKVRTKNVRIYGEHGVCNMLCLFIDHGWGRSYSLWSVPFKIKQKTVEGTDTPYEKGKKIINKPAANGVSTLLGKENQRKELRPTVV